jgi:hypothetical protein
MPQRFAGVRAAGDWTVARGDEVIDVLAAADQPRSCDA